MNQKKKIFSLVISIALIAVIGIGATLAYMTSTAGTVTNTFTVGNIKADIHEHEVDEKGKRVESPERVKSNEYHLIPGDIVDKDPFMTIGGGSADCYVFIQLSGIDALIAEDKAISIVGLLGEGSKWEPYSVADGKYDGIYIYKPSDIYKVVVGDSEYVTDPLFTGIKYDSTGKGSNIIVKEGTSGEKTVTTELSSKIKLKGAAVQFSGMEDKDAAYAEVMNFFYPKP